MEEYKPHNSIRGYFAWHLYHIMEKEKRINLILGDLGYGMFDRIRETYPDRVFNVGASEQAMIDVAVGMTLMGKIPVVYTITPFLLYRPYESILQYVDRERLPVKMIGSGTEKDYKDDGFSHWDFTGGALFDIESTIFEKIEDIKPRKEIKEILTDDSPHIVLLRR